MPGMGERVPKQLVPLPMDENAAHRKHPGMDFVHNVVGRHETACSGFSPGREMRPISPPEKDPARS